MVGISASHLKAVTVSLTRVFCQGDGNGLSVPIGHLCTNLAVKPTLIHTRGARVGTHVVVRTAVFKADTVFDDGIGCAYALEEIPSVVRVTPCTATDIVVSGAGELLIGKAVGIAAEVGGSTGHGLIIEIMVAIHIFDDVVTSVLHLTSGISRSVDVEVLKKAVGPFVVEIVLTRIAER